MDCGSTCCLDTALAWVNLWIQGKVPSPVAITLQESCTKLVEALCQRWDKAIRRALGPRQMGAGNAAVAPGPGMLTGGCTPREHCSTDYANVIGTLYRERQSPRSTGNRSSFPALLGICVARNGNRSVDERTPRLAPTRDTPRSPTRINTLSDSVCPCVGNRCPRRTT